MSCIEWVEIIEPRTRDFMYANLTTGECVWDPPEGVEIKRSDDNQWWELFDVNTRRFYYYNVASHTTVWHRPLNSDIIPLAKLQCLKQFSSGGSGSGSEFIAPEQRRPDSFLPQPSQPKKKSFSSASGDFDATYENQQTLDRNTTSSKCAHRKQITSGVSVDGNCRSLRLSSSASSSRQPHGDSVSAHNVPYGNILGATSSDYEHRLEQDLPSNYNPFGTNTSNTSSSRGEILGSGVPVHSTSTPQLKKKYHGQSQAQPLPQQGGYTSSTSRDGMTSLGKTGSQGRTHSDVEYTNSSALMGGGASSITRSGSFISSPHAQPQKLQSQQSLRSSGQRNHSSNNNPRDLLGMGGSGGGGLVNSDDDSMHEKYFKSVESTPQANRRRNTNTNNNNSSGQGISSSSGHSKQQQQQPVHSSDSSPHGAVAAVKVSSSSANNRNNINNNNSHNKNMSLDINNTTTSTNRSSRSNPPSRELLLEKPEKYLDKMLLQERSQRDPKRESSQMKLPLNVESQFVSKTATITSQSNLSGGSMPRGGTNSRISPKSVSPGSQELLLSKTNLERHNRDLAQNETQAKLKKKSPGNTAVKQPVKGGVSRNQSQQPTIQQKTTKDRQGRSNNTNTYTSDVDYDAGNMSPLYSNWDQQEHLLPLQHYIIEQAKLSKYNKYFGGADEDADEEDAVESEDSLHSDSQSEHSLSGHEPDNEDSDHSESRGDYLTYQHFMPAETDADRQNYYNVFDKSNNGREDFRSSEAEAKLESVLDNLYSPVQGNQFFNPVMQQQRNPQQPHHHSQSSVDGIGGGRLSPMRQLQRSLQIHAPPNLSAHIPPPLPPSAAGAASSTLAALKFFNAPEEYPNQPIYGTQFGIVAPLAIMKETDIEKFAQDNLNLHAKGIFRKKSSVRDMLSWTADAISRPMLALARDKAGKKMAIELFKLVQIYMGDRKARQGMSLNSVAIDVITLGVMQPALRDELYVQLCRQTTENPSRESMIRGWELMAICLAFLSPSPTFQPALLNYMNRHHDPSFATSFPEFCKWPIHVQVSHYAKVACKRLERIGSSGKKPTKKPSEEEVNQARMQIFRDSMFGNTLEEVMLLQRERFPNRQLPWLQVMLSEQVVMMGGKETEGIFRVPADLDEIGMVKQRLDQWEIPDIPSMDAHTPACLLKLWYRELYDPLIPDDLYEDCIQSDDPARVAGIVEQLPPINRLVLTYLIHFLQEFSQPSVVANTKMDSSNLAMVFAPNCLRCTSQDPKVIMENTRKEMAFLRTLITTMDTKHVANML